MGTETKIEWCHHTFNPWRGCTKVSPGCDNCYAEALSGQNPAVLGEWGPDGSRSIGAEAYWQLPIKWNNDARASASRRRVFCLSLGDILEGPDSMPPESWAPVQAARRRIRDHVRFTPWLDWLFLTKRPENSALMYFDRWPGNAWLGVSVEDQARAEARLPWLRAIDARIKFVSYEPALGPVDFRRLENGDLPGTWDALGGRVIDWIIAGGESGHGSRPMNPRWPASVRDQCRDTGVAFMFKQWGDWVAAGPGSGLSLERAKGSTHWFEHEGGIIVNRVGKRAAGRLLDGRTWDQYPETGAMS